jgi:hypothetical protein
MVKNNDTNKVTAASGISKTDSQILCLEAITLVAPKSALSLVGFGFGWKPLS